jgi:DNA repair exonuclease SbcCD ATPase subunit
VSCDIKLMISFLEPLRESVSGFQTGCTDMEERLEELFQEMEQLRSELVNRTSRLDQQQAKLEDQEQQLASSHEEIADLKAELEETRRQLIEARQTPAPPLTAPRDSAEIDQLDRLTRERDALEEELELVRGRASELTETVAAQERQLTQREANTFDELKQLKRLVEQQAELISERSRPQPHLLPVPERSSAAAPGENDAVVSSVMAQFAKLQKNVSQRRRPSR